MKQFYNLGKVVSFMCICLHILSAHLLDYDALDYQTDSIIAKRSGLLANLSNIDHITPFLKFNNQLKSHIEGTKNDKIILQCRVSASPPAIIYWEFHKSQTPLYERNIVTRDRSKLWNADYLPSIGNSVESYGVGDRNHMFGSKVGNYGGYRERRDIIKDKEEDINDSPILVNDMEDKGDYTPRQLGLSVTKSKLELDCLDDDNAGTYVCVAENAVKIIKQSTILNVKDKGKPNCEPESDVKVRPNFYLSSHNAQKGDVIAANGKRERPKITPARIYMWTENRIDNQGTNVRIFCRTSGKPKPMIAWLSPMGTTLHTNDKYKLLKNGDLYIKNISWKDDMGLYICLVKNKYGSDHKEAFLYPLEKNGDEEDLEL